MGQQTLPLSDLQNIFFIEAFTIESVDKRAFIRHDRKTEICI